MAEKAGGAAAHSEDPRAVVEQLRRRVRRAGLIATVAGALDTFCAVGFVIPVFYNDSLANRTGLLNAPVLVVVVAIMIAAANRIGDRRVEPVRRWLEAGCPSDGEAVSVALRLPLINARISAALWLVGALLFGVFNAILVSPAFGFLVGCTVASGGLTTAALIYLLVERIDRPITARALAVLPGGTVPGPAIRTRLIAAWALGTGVPLAVAAIIGIVGVIRPGASPRDVGWAVLFLALLALATGLLALLFAARSIAEPVAAVRLGVERVQAGDFAARVAVDDASEVGLLQAGFNRMAAGLDERERLRDLFGRHVGRDVAAAALDEGVVLGGEEREVAALFVDVVGSTRLASERTPSEVVVLLNRFFAVVVGVVESCGGLVNKFEGDAALVVFGAPVARPRPAADALRAARALAERLRGEVPELDFGIGVSAGLAVAGNIGAEERFEYTVIGDPVNEAARLCELAKRRPERLLASAAAVAAAGPMERESWRVGDRVVLRGRSAETGLATPAAPMAELQAG